MLESTVELEPHPGQCAISEDTLHEHIAATTAPGDAVTVATNEEARELNARIQTARLERDELDHTRTVTGSDGLDIGAGDVIQARKNDSGIGVANRQTFTVQHVTDDGTVYAVENGSDRRRQQTVRLPAEYVEAHAHLAYASTAYGVQGVTVDGSHTVLGEGLDGAGTYVGMTRGRGNNALHIIAENEADAREQFVQAVERDRADRGLDAATLDAREAVSGLITNGPVVFVNAERERLSKAIAHAETQAVKWEQAAALIAELRQAHATEREQYTAAVTAAEEHAQEVRQEVVTPLMAAAVADGQNLLTAQQVAWDAGRTYQQAGRLRRRTTARTRDDANRTREHLQTEAWKRWGTIPNTRESLETWSQTVAQKQADQYPAVVDAEREEQDARSAAGQLARKQLAQSQQLRARVYGKDDRAPEGGPAGYAARWRHRVEAMERTLNEIEALPAVEAAQLIRQQHANTEARRIEVERVRAERAKQIAVTEHQPRQHTDPKRERGIGY